MSIKVVIDTNILVAGLIGSKGPNREILTGHTDNHIIELSIAANADYIVTNNLKDFAQPELLHAGYEVISPQQLLRRIRS
jgi:predicted nucleic acid-binding protein